MLLISLELAQQFSKYDGDDGRSLHTDQNLNDENCFNQLRQELCSTREYLLFKKSNLFINLLVFAILVEMKSSDEDAILNEYLLTILRDIQLPSNDQHVTAANKT